MILSKEKQTIIEEEFSSEKGFWNVVKNCYSADKIKKSSIFFMLICFVVITCFTYPVSRASETSKTLLPFFDIGVTFSVGILGFLITGFSIYSTFLNTDLMFFLITYKEKGDKFNKFHKNYLFFFKPFFNFLSLLLFSIVYKFTFISWGAYKHFVESIILKYNLQNYFDWFTALILSLYLLLLLYCIIALKDFIYNIYNSAKTIGRFEFLRRNNKIGLEDLIKALENKENSEDNK